MSDYGSTQRGTQDAVNATLQKSAELSQATMAQLIQLFQEHSQHNQGHRNPQDYITLFHSFYDAYLNNGVEPEIAKAAASDASLGYGSQASTAIALAEKQIVVSNQDKAQSYKQAVATAGDPQQPIEQRKAAAVQKHTLEHKFGIQNQPLAIKAKRIQALSNGQVLADNFNQQFQHYGVSPETAQAASRDLAVGKGALNSPAIAQAHQVIRPNFRQQLVHAGLDIEWAKELSKLRDAALAEAEEAASSGRDLSEWANRFERNIRDEISSLDHQETILTQFHIDLRETKVETAQRLGQRPNAHHEHLTTLYQGVFQKHGVPEQDAIAAGDQLARGNGANESPLVAKAYHQALGNIEKAHNHRPSRKSAQQQLSQNTKKKEKSRSRGTGY